MEAPDKPSWLRITLLVIGLLSMIPLTLLFGAFGFIAGIVFLVIVAIAK